MTPQEEQELRTSTPKLPIVGNKYRTRLYPSLGFPTLHTVKVVEVTTLGDGTTVVKYRHGWITEYAQLEEFLSNTEVQDA